MKLDAESLGRNADFDSDVAVIGAGPAGIVLTLELARQGHDVLLIESGADRPRQEIQQLGDAAQFDPHRHAPMHLATARRVGGTSTIWGGRCVPPDRVDLDGRPYVPDARWPIAYDELARLFGRACEWLVCGRPVFDARDAGLPASLTPALTDGEVQTRDLERWSLPTDFGREYRRELETSPRVRLLTSLTCTRLDDGGRGRLEAAECKTLTGNTVRVRARHFVIACGGLESTRLLLASPGSNGGPIGDHSGHLGNWYMGHIEGAIAHIELNGPARGTIYGYERDTDGVYVRRRITTPREVQLREGLPNIVGWLANPELQDHRHGSGPLSVAYLALKSPLGRRFAPDAQRLSLTGQDVPGSPYRGGDTGPIGRHLANILRQPLESAKFAVSFGSRRFLSRRRRVPGFFAYRPDNTYSLQYHGEHRPRKDSRVFLSDDRDALGLPRLCIDVRFSDADVDGVIRAHNHWDRYLGELGAGRIRYKSDEPAELVRERLGAGFHQSGTTRMASRAEDGVVDAELTVHGLANLSVLSSSVFVTSSQANSTFLIVVLAVRLAERLRSVLGAVPSVQRTLAVQSEASDAAPTTTTVEPSTSVGDQRPA